MTYQHEGPWCGPVVVAKVVHEETHDTPDDYARDELHASQRVEGYARVLRRRSLCATVERVQHARDCGLDRCVQRLRQFRSPGSARPAFVRSKGRVVVV